jgi:hypothetical protein
MLHESTEAEFRLIWGDLQTFMRDIWYNVKYPHHHPKNITAAGELHGRFHVQHGDLRQNELLIYGPMFMHFGVKGLSSDKLPMKMYSTLERWTFVIAAGTIMWLRSMFSAAEIRDVKKLLKSVKRNLPVCNMIGWLFYNATFIYGNKKAVRVNDHERLDFMWQYSLILYSLTNKYMYKKGCLMMLKILKDSEANITNLLRTWRTYSEHGRPCSGG